MNNAQNQNGKVLEGALAGYQFRCCGNNIAGVHLAGGGRRGFPGFWPRGLFQYSPNCALKFLTIYKQHSLKNFQRCFKKNTKAWFSPVRLICSHSFLLNNVPNRTGVDVHFYRTESNLLNFCVIISENKRKRFVFNRKRTDNLLVSEPLPFFKTVQILSSNS